MSRDRNESPVEGFIRTYRDHYGEDPSQEHLELVEKCFSYSTVDRGESATSLFVFSDEVTDDEAYTIVQMMGLDPDETHNTRDYDCTGRWYHSCLRLDNPGGRFRLGYIDHYLDV